MKVGIQQQDLDRLRAEAQADPGRVGAGSVQPQNPDRTAEESGTQGMGSELSAATAEGMSRDLATKYPQPEVRATGGGPTVAAAPPPIGGQPPGDLVRECFSAGGADRGIGRVHNRFAYCLRVPLEAEYWEVDSRGVPIEKEGTTKANLEVFTQGDNLERRVRVFARFQEDSVDYDWGPIDNIFVAPNVPESLIAQCVQSNRVCHATRGPATMSWAAWDNNTAWAYWDVYNHEEASEGRDKLSYNQWLVETFTDDGKYRTLIRGRTAPRMLRCDSAGYFVKGTARYPMACIHNEVIPHLNYQLGGSNHHSVAFHIYQAQFQPNTTYPLLVPAGVPPPRDKRIPGRFVAGDARAPGLHRITEELHPGEYKDNSDHKDGACYKRGPHRDLYYDTGLPVPPDTPAEQCDEYPFASTLEGAAHPYWDFSVKAVPWQDNNNAGNILRNYYVDDRILAWDFGLDRPDETNDRFYVHIE